MFEKHNFNHIPTEYEIEEYINNDLWKSFCDYMKETYNTVPKFEFSRCNWEYSWNIKFRKGSKSLCTIYPRENYFTILIVIGKNEKNFLKICFHLLVIIYRIFIRKHQKQTLKDG